MALRGALAALAASRSLKHFTGAEKCAILPAYKRTDAAATLKLDESVSRSPYSGTAGRAQALLLLGMLCTAAVPRHRQLWQQPLANRRRARKWASPSLSAPTRCVYFFALAMDTRGQSSKLPNRMHASGFRLFRCPVGRPLREHQSSAGAAAAARHRGVLLGTRVTNTSTAHASCTCTCTCTCNHSTPAMRSGPSWLMMMRTRNSACETARLPAPPRHNNATTNEEWSKETLKLEIKNANTQAPRTPGCAAGAAVRDCACLRGEPAAVPQHRRRGAHAAAARPAAVRAQGRRGATPMLSSSAQLHCHQLDRRVCAAACDRAAAYTARARNRRLHCAVVIHLGGASVHLLEGRCSTEGLCYHCRAPSVATLAGSASGRGRSTWTSSSMKTPP